MGSQPRRLGPPPLEWRSEIARHLDLQARELVTLTRDEAIVARVVNAISRHAYTTTDLNSDVISDGLAYVRAHLLRGEPLEFDATGSSAASLIAALAKEFPRKAGRQ